MRELKEHFCSASETYYNKSESPEAGTVENIAYYLEPWLSALLQSEHLSILAGSGLSTAIAKVAGVSPATMQLSSVELPYADKINRYSRRSAAESGRGEANIEDQIRGAQTLYDGLRVLESEEAPKLKTSLNGMLRNFIESILKCEEDLDTQISNNKDNANDALNLLTSLLGSFSSRPPSRDRTHVFTTNYDRILEFGADRAGLRMIDRFVGSIAPELRAPRLDIDMHYSPPGVRGEPRYLDGVFRYTKLHGSVDWLNYKGRVLRQSMPFGAKNDHPGIPDDPLSTTMIYPNPAKDVETSAYPYSELFRDFSAALCRPNSTLITYGYGFGDSHINRIIRDMLTIPSTHLVVISYDDPGDRVSNFISEYVERGQATLLLGSHFGDLETLVLNYLPNPNFEPVMSRQAELMGNKQKSLSCTLKTDFEDNNNDNSL